MPEPTTDRRSHSSLREPGQGRAGLPWRRP